MFPPCRQGIRAVLAGKWPEMPWNPLLLCGNGLQNVRLLARLLQDALWRCLHPMLLHS